MSGYMSELNFVPIKVTTQRDCGLRFGKGDIVYASIDLKTIKQFKVVGIFVVSNNSEIWYRLEPTQFLPENRVFKSASECRNDLIKRFNGENHTIL